ncbi:UPF0028 protein YchK [hydrothermal vent metagenome]|uniref:UPF0028 protein YchK n=1 Tax=hydrothermal vent metagenome TaxID=652676 RepID=A0A3B0TJB4_9ZZZZ
MQANPTPIIGIALGSGAARGWAHIGVMRGLAKAGIVPQIVAGTSIGALVGGCEVAGQLDMLEAFARDLSRRRLLSLLDLTFSGAGLLRGDKLTRMLEASLGDQRIETLERKFVAIATELTTGHEIWLRTGGLTSALRASYALPGIFPPVRLDRRLLIDGALVNPIPTSTARAFGARLVIAVDLSPDAMDRSVLLNGDTDLAESGAEASNGDMLSAFKTRIFGTRAAEPSVVNVMLGAFNISLDRIARARLASDPPDVIIAPKIGAIGLTDFDKADEAIALGHDAAIAAVPKIREMLTLLA